MGEKKKVFIGKNGSVPWDDLPLEMPASSLGCPSAYDQPATNRKFQRSFQLRMLIINPVCYLCPRLAINPAINPQISSLILVYKKGFHNLGYIYQKENSDLTLLIGLTWLYLWLTSSRILSKITNPVKR